MDAPLVASVSMYMQVTAIAKVGSAFIWEDSQAGQPSGIKEEGSEESIMIPLLLLLLDDCFLTSLLLLLLFALLLLPAVVSDVLLLLASAAWSGCFCLALAELLLLPEEALDPVLSKLIFSTMDTIISKRLQAVRTAAV